MTYPLFHLVGTSQLLYQIISANLLKLKYFEVLKEKKNRNLAGIGACLTKTNLKTNLKNLRGTMWPLLIKTQTRRQFPRSVKISYSLPNLQKMIAQYAPIIEKFRYCRIWVKYLKEQCTTESIFSSPISIPYINFNLASGKIILKNMPF